MSCNFTLIDTIITCTCIYTHILATLFYMFKYFCSNLRISSRPSCMKKRSLVGITAQGNSDL